MSSTIKDPDHTKYNQTFITPYHISHPPEEKAEIIPFIEDSSSARASSDPTVTRQVGRELADRWEEKYGFRLAVKLAAVGTGLDVYVEKGSNEGQEALNFVSRRTQVNLKAIDELEKESRLPHMMQRAGARLDKGDWAGAEKWIERVKTEPSYFDNYEVMNAIGHMEFEIAVLKSKGQ